MLRMVVTTEAELLEQILNPPFLSSQVAAMLSSQDLKIIVSALQLSETLLTKLPDQFSVHFRREGILHHVTRDWKWMFQQKPQTVCFWMSRMSCFLKGVQANRGLLHTKCRQ